MAKSNRDRVGDALTLLGRGLRPFVEQEMKGIYKDRWQEQAAHSLSGGRETELDEDKLNDVHSLLKIMWEQWRPVFGKILGHSERSLVSELRDVRNRWAHQESFSTDDAYRALDSAHRLLIAVSAGEEADAIDSQRQELLRVRFDERARKTSKQATLAAVEGQAKSGLKPWRDLVTPHPDVASGKYQQAEFAADLGQVHKGEGSDEYRDPTEFFRRTYLTEGLRMLLSGALQRLSGTGGDPVVELQTNFGGGKTHSLLALYHLFSGISAGKLPGIEPVLKDASTEKLPTTKRVVLVGTRLSPSQPHRVDGLEIRTMWGELAWQLGGVDAYKMVAEADATGTNPGAALMELFRQHAPCLILIDEWVAYARQLYGKDNLYGGTFDTHFSFAQTLTEAARAVPQVMVVISTPASERIGGTDAASDIEVGGEGGQAALERLKNVIGRIQSPWRPANAEESFEIVRRRLFQPIRNEEDFRERDAVARAFYDLYSSQAQEFPSQCKEASYERRIQAAYPIHPELFDRLYEDWSSLEKFQRTRGVLRLMAAVIHTLWERQDSGLLIMPANVPIDDSSVREELTRYLEDNWIPVIEKDVDGPNSLPLELDRQNPNLGRLSACRRVARTLYLGSAPTTKSANRGLEDIDIKLGCVQPGESPAVFGDALRRLADNATHLYVDGKRYWLDTHPTVNRLAKDRAGQYREDEVHEEIVRRLRTDRQRGDFAGVHIAPSSAGDVPDNDEVRLVVLGPADAYSAKSAESGALAQATEILEKRGNSPRRYRNMLVFLAGDSDRLAGLEAAVRSYLSWKSIEEEGEELNLDAFQSKLARTKREQANETVNQQILESFQWLLVPEQPQVEGAVEWQRIRVKGQAPLAVRASKKLQNEDLLITKYGSTPLRLELDRIPLWQGDHVGLRQAWEYFAQYLYLPRLRDSSVFVEAVQSGLDVLTWVEDSFAYADGYDEAAGRYRNLCAGKQGSVIMDDQSLIVKPETAKEQLEREAAAGEGEGEGEGGAGPKGAPPEGPETPEAPEVVLRRFHGTVTLNNVRIGRDASEIAENIIEHLTNCPGADVEVVLEIQARIPEGAPDNVVRTVLENAKTLKFQSSEFERE